MTQISDEEIEPGLVVWMDGTALAADAEVTTTTPFPGDPGTRPFLCLERDGESSTWAQVTTTERLERVAFKQEWLSGGGPGWTSRQQFLVDGANVCIGPCSAFCAASAADRTGVGNRARLSKEGVAAALAEVEAQRHRRRPGT